MSGEPRIRQQYQSLTHYAWFFKQEAMTLMKTTRRRFLKTVVAGTAGATVGIDPAKLHASTTVSFTAVWPNKVERTFVGPEYWANRLQDWRVRDGRAECVDKRPVSPHRTLHLLTHRLSDRSAGFEISLSTGLVDAGTPTSDAASGILIGAGGTSMDYRAAALIHHQPGPGGGVFAGCDASGQVFLRDFESPAPKVEMAKVIDQAPAELRLQLIATPLGDVSELTLIARDGKEPERSRAIQKFPSVKLSGNIALVSHPGTGPNTASFWFRDWRVSGDRIEANPDRACGPIISTMYTLSRGGLKLTAQLFPVGAQESQTADLQIKRGGGWKTFATAKINPSGWVAQFRVEKWDAGHDAAFRVRYMLKGADGKPQPHYWEGTIKRDPVDKQRIVVASLSCVEQINGGLAANPTYAWTRRVWFPHPDLVPNLTKHDPDLYFFAGDQIYEGNPTRLVLEPVEEAELDYLYKWYLWCWSFGGLIRHTPTICIPDDHDVYHGNIWGMGGHPAARDDRRGLLGGYAMPPVWLNMIQRTQTSHLPDPADPTPAGNLGVYYTSMTLGEIGFIILEDRKFKSSPTIVDAPKTPDSHITQKDFDTRKADVPGAALLGERQLKFLREFAEDWRGQKMKAVLSQTIFCNLQISSRPPTTGELDKDLDSNGWPQSGRIAALDAMRRGFMIHLAGDQHLASAIHHGIDEYGDACWSQCSPATANFYTRFWNPDYPPVDGKPGKLPFTGNYEDGFHNKLTVYAVANPVNNPEPRQYPEPVELHRKAPGYNIVRFNKADRTITLETWPRYVDPSDPKTGRQYEGWPITIKQADNYGRKAVAFLPVLRIKGINDAVVQVIDEKGGEVIYTLRIKGTEFRPKVFARGNYTVKVGEQGTARLKTITGIAAIDESQHEIITVKL
jgi:PhoD-like phosphatase